MITSITKIGEITNYKIGEITNYKIGEIPKKICEIAN